MYNANVMTNTGIVEMPCRLWFTSWYIPGRLNIFLVCSYLKRMISTWVVAFLVLNPTATFSYRQYLSMKYTMKGSYIVALFLLFRYVLLNIILRSNHMHVCSCCNMRFGTNHILELHIRSGILVSFSKLEAPKQSLVWCPTAKSMTRILKFYQSTRTWLASCTLIFYNSPSNSACRIFN